MSVNAVKYTVNFGTNTTTQVTGSFVVGYPAGVTYSYLPNDSSNTIQTNPAGSALPTLLDVEFTAIRDGVTTIFDSSTMNPSNILEFRIGNAPGSANSFQNNTFQLTASLGGDIPFQMLRITYTDQLLDGTITQGYDNQSGQTMYYNGGTGNFGEAEFGDFSSIEAAAGTFDESGGFTEPTPVCFTPGTLISTPTGSTPVQDLHIGDLILNHEGQSVPVKWIGIQRFHPAFIKDRLPVCFSQGALGYGLPLRDLYVSPGHAMYIDNCLLIDAKALINGTTITQVTQWKGDVEYLHIETENHEIILAEGAPAETFMDNVSRACFNNYSEYEALYPDAKEMIELDIPRVSHQRQLPNTIKHKLEALAEVLIGEVNADKERMVG